MVECPQQRYMRTMSLEMEKMARVYMTITKVPEEDQDLVLTQVLDMIMARCYHNGVRVLTHN